MKRFLLIWFSILFGITLLPAYASSARSHHHRDSLSSLPLQHTSSFSAPGLHLQFTTRKDTLVFYPSSFHLDQEEKLYDLLKQIPGIQQQEGKIHWHGKEITLQIQRNEYFGGNGILYRIPEKAVKEILIYNSLSPLSLETKRVDPEEDYILDIILQPEYVSLWFANALAGIQNSKRYELEVEGLHLSPSNPIAGFINVNNRNGLTPCPPVFISSSEFDQFGKQQFGALSYQHNWDTQQRGIQLKHSAYINTSLGHQSGWGTQNEYIENYLYDNSRNYSVSQTRKDLHRFSPTFNHELSLTVNPRNSFTFNTDFSFIHTNDCSETEEILLTVNPFLLPSSTGMTALTDAADSLLLRNLLNQSNHLVCSQGRQYHLLFNGKWKTLLRHRNKLEMTVTFRRQQSDEQYDATIHLEHPQAPPELQQQYNSMPGYRNEVGINTFYQHWLSRHFLFSGNYKFSSANAHERQEHYLYLGSDLSHEEIRNHRDSINSYRHQYQRHRHLFDALLTYKYRHMSIMPRLALQLSHEAAHHHRVLIDTVIHRRPLLWNPSLKIQWQRAPLFSSYIKYEQQLQQPNLFDVIPWIDNTDPIYNKRGNTRLHSNKIQIGKVYFQLTLPRPQITLSSQATLIHQSSPLTEVYTFNPANNNFSIQQQNALHPTYSIHWHLDFHQQMFPQWKYQLWLQFLMENKDGFLTTTTTHETLASNRQRFLQFQLYPQLTFDNHRFLRCTVYGNLVFTGNQYKNFAKTYHELRLYDYGVRIETNIRNFQLRSDLHDCINKGYNNPRVNGHRCLWSASAAYFCLKGRGTLRIVFDDILNKTDLYDRKIEPNRHAEIYKDKLHHYINLSFSYRFDGRSSHQRSTANTAF